MEGLTNKQKEYLSYIEQFIKDVGYPPTQRECANAFGVTAMAARDVIYTLKKKGYIDFIEGKYRTIKVLKRSLQESN